MKTPFRDPDLDRVEVWLDHFVTLAEERLKEKLADRSKALSTPKFNKTTTRRCCIGMFFPVWLGFAITLFCFSLLDDQCGMIVQKHEDYSTPVHRNSTSAWCFLGVSEEQTNLIEALNSEAVISYMVYRQWRSSVFFNMSVLLFGALLAKIATNFVSGEPGFAGLRLHGTLNFPCFKISFKHKDLELSCDPKYHIHRYLEEKDIYIDDFMRKYSIDHMYETCTQHEMQATRANQVQSDAPNGPTAV